LFHDQLMKLIVSYECERKEFTELPPFTLIDDASTEYRYIISLYASKYLPRTTFQCSDQIAAVERCQKKQIQTESL